ncbi:MAG: restriction endonuclease subunit S [Vibrio sp.]
MSHLSYIEKLLDGVEVEWRPLEKVIHSLKTGLNPRKNFQLNTSDAQGYYVTVREIQDGKIVFLEKTDRVNDRALELINGRSNLEVGDILFSGTGTVGRTAVIEAKPANWNIKEGVYTIKPIQEKILPRFLSHLLNSSEIVKDYGKKIVGNPVVSLPMGELKKLLVPIPCPDNPEKSLAIQAEIVRVLDAFTAMTAELTAELNMRKKQYNYYRDQLLSFEEGDVEWKALGEVFNIFAGGDKPKDAFSEEETDEFNVPILSNGIGLKSLYGWTNLPKITEPSLTVSARGTIGWTSYRDRPFFPIIRLLVLTPKIGVNTKYAYYYMKTIENNYPVPPAGIPQLTKPMIENVQFPIPYPNDPERSQAEQARIVAILDKFDALTNSITEGLPREIELRQKQYEYYRDLLLSFPKSHSDEAA